MRISLWDSATHAVARYAQGSLHTICTHTVSVQSICMHLCFWCCLYFLCWCSLRIWYAQKCSHRTSFWCTGQSPSATCSTWSRIFICCLHGKIYVHHDEDASIHSIANEEWIYTQARGRDTIPCGKTVETYQKKLDAEVGCGGFGKIFRIPKKAFPTLLSSKALTHWLPDAKASCVLHRYGNRTDVEIIAWEGSKRLPSRPSPAYLSFRYLENPSSSSACRYLPAQFWPTVLQPLDHTEIQATEYQAEICFHDLHLAKPTGLISNLICWNPFSAKILPSRSRTACVVHLHHFHKIFGLPLRVFLHLLPEEFLPERPGVALDRKGSCRRMYLRWRCEVVKMMFILLKCYNNVFHFHFLNSMLCFFSEPRWT